ncbi:MAG: hypothetical protein A3F17_03425 [Gammaproteobacteria bacterium RIFCSPHIGHO2_12_FULL_41_15]|nr:MAG: hypothetical protein A3F17_03425 [Gammaproteobacteria bacterium RIFCSPHIGHO2_12_FULL_41_15]
MNFASNWLIHKSLRKLITNQLLVNLQNRIMEKVYENYFFYRLRTPWLHRINFYGESLEKQLKKMETPVETEID